MDSTQNGKPIQSSIFLDHKIGCDALMNTHVQFVSGLTGACFPVSALPTPEPSSADDVLRERVNQWVTQAIYMYENHREMFTRDRLWLLRPCRFLWWKGNPMLLVPLTSASSELESRQQREDFISSALSSLEEKSAS